MSLSGSRYWKIEYEGCVVRKCEYGMSEGWLCAWDGYENMAMGSERKMGMKGGHACMVPMHVWNFMRGEKMKEKE